MLSACNSINLNKRENCFELFGYDIILDSECNPYLIEINTNPGLEDSSPLIKLLIPRMINDMFKLTIDKIFENDYKYINNNSLSCKLNKKTDNQNKTENKVNSVNNIKLIKNTNLCDNELKNKYTYYKSSTYKKFEKIIKDNAKKLDVKKLNIDYIKKIAKDNCNKSNNNTILEENNYIFRESNNIITKKDSEKLVKFNEEFSIVNQLKIKLNTGKTTNNIELPSITNKNNLFKNLSLANSNYPNMKEIYNAYFVNNTYNNYSVPGYSDNINLWERICNLNENSSISSLFSAKLVKVPVKFSKTFKLIKNRIKN